MARFTDETINRIKTEISLLRLVESQGHQPKRQGKDWAIRCPFHEGDDTPSLVISPKTNLFHCFGCDAAGSVIDWVMRTRGVSFRFACELLQNDAGLVAEGSAQPVKKNTTTKLSIPRQSRGL
ncbi:CHC2 zinc finger domain-containing protein [Methylocaldum sp. SAD2]|jgi:DNA primase|uniref:CHC2 zinc finger domain-containing protein n=1 Tax=Methylocaldum sp. GT1BB TaxID=3438963 RepID=UPI000A32873F